MHGTTVCVRNARSTINIFHEVCFYVVLRVVFSTYTRGIPKKKKLEAKVPVDELFIV